MNLIAMISLRNLFRQKRRNILLGTAIAFGMMILVIASSFSHGISDIMFNKIVRYVAGHVRISFNEKGGTQRQIFRDKTRIMDLIKENAEINNNEYGVLEYDESVGVFCRAIGNGKSDNVMVVGIDTKQDLSEETRKEVEESFKMIEGKYEDLNRTDVENPVILSYEKAKYLNVKMNDVLRVRFKTVLGQEQAARLTVIGIMKNDNVFMSGVVFLQIRDLKRLMAYSEWETGTIQLNLRDAKKDAVKVADAIHKALEPGLAYIPGTISKKNSTARKDAIVYGYKYDEKEHDALFKLFTLVSGKQETLHSKNTVIVGQKLAKALNVKPGDRLMVRYGSLYAGDVTVDLDVTHVVSFTDERFDSAVLTVENEFYDMYYDKLPRTLTGGNEKVLPLKSDAVYPALTTEWILLDRTKTSTEAAQKYRDLGKRKWKATVIDVSTMYETASDVLKLENALNLITLIAVMILFFIILIGVVNTLRMTIRERTREIGTIRAIGMQKTDVRNSFILETFFLTLFACIAGIVLAFVVMGLFSHITLNSSVDNPLGMLLVNGHLRFLPTFGGIFGNLLLILTIAVVTAFFPANKAAKMNAADALRHFE